MDPGAAPPRRATIAAAALLVLSPVWGSSGSRSARADGEGRKPAGAVDLRGAPIRDVPTTVAVPIGPDRSVVLRLPAGFWIQCPRHLRVPTSLAGDGLIVQFLNARGGTTSLLYVGAEPMAPAEEDETALPDVETAVRDFVGRLRDRYRGVDWEVTTTDIAAGAVTLKVNGRKTPAWRTGRYRSRPAQPYGGPESTFVGECVVFRPEGADRLVYVALDAKAGGTTLDRVIQDVSVVPTVEVNGSGRVVQLNDLAEGAEGRFPVRLLSYDAPPGFVLTPAVFALRGDLVYAEDRPDARGRPTASHRIDQVPASDGTPQEDAAAVRAEFEPDAAGPLREVALATPGARAWTFEHPGKCEGRASLACTAVLRFDDLTLIFTWHTFGDAAQVEKDRESFRTLLAGMRLAVRW